MFGFPKVLHAFFKASVEKNTDEFEDKQLMNFNSILLFETFILFFSVSLSMLQKENGHYLKGSYDYHNLNTSIT